MNEVPGQLNEIVALLVHFRKIFERRFELILEQELREPVHLLKTHPAGQPLGGREIDLAFDARELIKQGLRIPQAALRRRRHELQGRRFDVYLFLRRDQAELGEYLALGELFEDEPLGAGSDGGRQFLVFGGREHEDHVRGRLLQGF